VQSPAAVRAGADVRRDLDLMARQMGRQRRPRRIWRALLRRRGTNLLKRFGALRLDQIDLTHGDVGIFECQQ